MMQDVFVMWSYLWGGKGSGEDSIRRLSTGTSYQETQPSSTRHPHMYLYTSSVCVRAKITDYCRYPKVTKDVLMCLNKKNR